MKILLINYTDSGGGAANAAFQLVTTLNEYGYYAKLGVVEKTSNSSYVFELPKKHHTILNKLFIKFWGYFLKLIHPITKHFHNPFVFRTSNGILHTTNFKSETDINWINNSEFDLINLHWISGVICNKDITKITKPIIWTMHDSWPCCGAEHHPNILENDERWKQGYYRNNKPNTTKGTDLCRKVWNQKKKYLSKKKITFIAPSTWEHNVLKSSALFGNCNCFVVPNIINHLDFNSKDKLSVRKMLDIPTDKIVLGFGAAYNIDNPKSMKGSFYLIEALKKLKNPENYFLVIFGPAGNSFTSRINIPYFSSGYISNKKILACLYSACDCVVNPSLIENLPTTCLESICCGVPVVAFDVGGTSDIVEHQKTGFLATPYKTEELVEGIEWCLLHQNELSNNCIEKSKKDFDTDNTIKKTVEVYSSVIIN